jgi:alpha-tubulin suppressor-like RCC1 family protein
MKIKSLIACAVVAAVVVGPRWALGQSDLGIAAWGNNDDGQCNVPSPNTGFVAIAAGGGHSLGLKDDGSILAWGDNYYGETGDSHLLSRQGIGKCPCLCRGTSRGRG